MGPSNKIVSQTTSWGGTLSESLKLGYADSELLVYLDDILKWYTSTLSGNLDELSRSMIETYGLRPFQVRFENLLDRLIINSAEVKFGPFKPTMARDKAKWRYRKLIGVFHPDKGANELAWLNYRAEKINKYYSEFKQAKLIALKEVNLDSRMSLNSKFRKRKKRSRVSKSVALQTNTATSRAKKTDWRDKFGDPILLESRVIAVAVTIFIFFSLLLISSLFLDP